MIRANELRVGNLFFDEDNTPCYFAGAWQRNDGWICRDSAGNTYKESELLPIPLTPEILEKCGFEFDGEIYNKDCLFISKYMNFLIHEPNGGYYDSKAIKSLHQLQNLYFALTGTELTVEL